MFEALGNKLICFLTLSYMRQSTPHVCFGEYKVSSNSRLAYFIIKIKTTKLCLIILDKEIPSFYLDNSMQSPFF